MKAVWNRTRRPLKIPLDRGQFLHLGPDKIGQVSDQAVERPSFRRLLEGGEIALLEEAAAPEEPSAPTGRQPRHEYAQRRTVVPSGGRTAGGRRER